VVVLFAIVSTGNHFLFDAAAGAVLAVVAGLIAHRVMSPMRPEAWAWGHRATILPAPPDPAPDPA
jgi:membrane-associated phospholipid phosphatase